jgi:signal transduction histidine kinase
MDTAAERSIAVAPFSWRSSDVEVLVRMPWGTGPCAYVLVRGAPLRFGGLLPQTKIWLLPITILFGAVLVAIGPVLRRIRALTEAVRQSASTAYQTDIVVTGNDEIGELAQAFDAAVRQIRLQIAERDRREKVLRDFLANTTHDVMIPLTVLQGHLATLRDRAPVADATMRSTVSLAMDEAHYLASLVHNLGAVARLDVDDAGAQRSRVDIAALAARVVGRHLPIASTRWPTSLFWNKR